MSMTTATMELKNGVKVCTMLDRTTTGWSPDAYRNRRNGVQGKIVSSHNSHGECFGVEHEDGVVAYYEPQELIIVPPEPIKCFDSRGRVFTIGDEVIYLPKLETKPGYDGNSITINRPSMKVSTVVRVSVTSPGFAACGPTVAVELADGTVLVGDGENGGWDCFKLEQQEKPTPPPPTPQRDNAPLEFGGQRYQA